GVLSDIGRLYHDQGKDAEALPVTERAAAIAEKSGSPQVLWEIYELLGRVQFALGNTAVARQSYEKGIAAVEEIRAQTVGTEEDWQRAVETLVGPWGGMVGVLAQQNRIEEALGFAEQAKARVLLDVLKSGRTGVETAMTADEQQQERKLRSELGALNTA